MIFFIMKTQSQLLVLTMKPIISTLSVSTRLFKRRTLPSNVAAISWTATTTASALPPFLVQLMQQQIWIHQLLLDSAAGTFATAAITTTTTSRSRKGEGKRCLRYQIYLHIGQRFRRGLLCLEAMISILLKKVYVTTIWELVSKSLLTLFFLTDSLADMLVTKTNRFSNLDASAHSYQN